MSMGILVLAFVVHARPLLLTNGSVRWMILMTRRERLRLRGTAWNIGGRKVCGGRGRKKSKGSV
jgi:hypothetical protein